jgi:hypothetical protein
MLLELFQKVLVEKCEKLGLEWYEVFDGEAFEEVEAEIVEMCGEEVLECEEYLEWVHEMAMDL